ncbi:hypothetical protein Glove_469g15 [Diversispora epigaea]|uniref:ZSWIM1/3 RNaseH-like domain-containing protein n=1 Tax=Diversispora epigaea TaxID=1348612 RepID=A0A397GLR0_9GLOM|nr:hypothetical protein Glove_469g15 [Diversispora epigaea]
MENLDETLEANKENLLVTAFTSGAITNGAIKKGAILLEKTENSRTKFYTSSQLTPDQKRELLFNVNQPFEVPMCEFDEEWWPLVSNIWTRYNYKNHTNGNSWKTFACHFTKHNPSSMRKEGIPDEKRRKTKIRSANLCFIKIKVSRFITEKKVYIERYQDKTRLFFVINPFKIMENLDETLEANKENLLVTAFTSGAITNGAIKKGAILLEKTENSRTKFYTSSQLTPDQKRELLFNVNQPFEVPMCEFDEEWWPLVSNIWTRYNYKNHTNGNSWKTFACHFTKHNPSSMRKEGIPDEKRRKTKIRSANLCFIKIKVSRFITEKKVYIERYQDSPDHTHTIEESEKLKRSQFVRNLVEQEAIKNYPPPAIVNAIKEYAIEKLDLSSSVKELRRKEVTNIKSKVYKPQNTYLTGNINLELDIEESVVFFKNQEYQHNPSSMRKEGIPDEKRRKTKIRSANLCFIKIKVSRFITEKKVYIERYQDSPDHTHTIEESEKLKRSQFVRNLVEQEAIKNYPPPAIVNAIKEYAIEKLDLSSSVKELRRKEVTNIKSKVYKPQNTYLTGNINLELDIEESVVFFKNQEYQVERFQILHRSSHGFVFAHPNQLEKLQHFGWLTLIDSTHKMNKYDWRLFTLYIRDNHGCWDVGVHFFISKEDSDTVAEALKIIRRFVCSWKPRYFLSDQSNVEANGIAIAFPGLSKGEQNCEVIFCTVHVMRTWMTKIYETKVRRKMIHALHKITKISCDELIQQAIDECQAPTVKQYILRNYIKNTNQWALWARQHSPLLLQITSTNAIESYHSELKRITVSHHGLIDAEYIAFEFRTKQISVVGIDFEIIDQIHKFPFPIQQKIVSEVHAVEERIEKGKDVPVLTSLNCYCLFFCQYLLPCQHILHNHLYGEKKLLTTNAWEQFQQMFMESGFEVYISHELVEIELPKKTEAEKAMENRRSTINELIERTRNAYWRVEEKGNAVQKSIFIETLKASLGSILNAEEQ